MGNLTVIKQLTSLKRTQMYPVTPGAAAAQQYPPPVQGRGPDVKNSQHG